MLFHSRIRAKQSDLKGEAMSSPWILSDDLLERCAQRAAGYDRENRFFLGDFDELREAKYLLAAVPAGTALGANSAGHQHASSGHGHCSRPVAGRR